MSKGKFGLGDVVFIGVSGAAAIGILYGAVSCMNAEDDKIARQNDHKEQVYDWYQYEATEEEQTEACEEFRLRWDRNEGWSAVGDWYQEERDVPEGLGYTHARAVSRMCNS